MADTSQPPIAHGLRVSLRGRTWRVEQRTRHMDCDSIRLRACEERADGRSQTFLLPFDRCVPLDGVRHDRVVGQRRFCHLVATHLLATHGFGDTRTARAAALGLQPFQFEPALAMLRHARLRLFIADSVGLGKTIQAGLIVSELAARSDNFRALLIVPAGLRPQWQEELRAKFSLDAAVADTRWLVAMTRELPADVNPWSLPGIYVASHDFLKQPEVLRGLEEVRWDLLVADEVHGASLGTARLAALQAVGARSRRVVLLSATPPDSEPAALRALANIGRFDGERPMTLFRRSRLDVGNSPARRTAWLAVRLSSAERLMHTRLERYAARIWRESTDRQDPAARLAAMVLKKRALSMAGSLLVSVRRRIALLTAGTRTSRQQLLLPLTEEDPLADDLDDGVLAAPGLADVDIERTLLAQVLEAASVAAASESKVRALGRLLRRVPEPVIVFTEYRDTVSRLAEAFASRQPAILTGAVPPSERSAVQRAFARDGSLLLATDAASEGLNLHQRCRIVIHFELPWVPMRLQQRAGRVDRMGQGKRVHEIILVARHTSERYVLAPLVRRIQRAANAGVQTPLASVSESAIAAGILGRSPIDAVAPTLPTPFESLPLRNEADVECRRLGSLRRIATHSSPARVGALQGVVIRRGRPRTNVATVLMRTRLAGDGTLDERLLVLLVTFQCVAPPGHLPRLRTITAEFARHVTPERLESCGALDSAKRAEDLMRTALSTLADRERAMTAAHTEHLPPVQAGLFDRRALRRADVHQRTASALIEESQARVSELTDRNLHRDFEIVAIAFDNWPPR